MSFEQIRTQARQEALRLHHEWITDELSGMSRQKLAAMHHNDEIIKTELSDIAGGEEESLSRRQIAWTELDFIALKRQTLEERNPKYIGKYLVNGVSHASSLSDKPSVKVGDRLEEFLADKKASKASILKSTLDEYRVALREFIEVHGDVEVSTIRIEDAKNHRDSLS
jgi:hypothetical protein